MALSVVNFRMHHGTTMEQITFSGNGIKLLDLKKEILDKKEISRSLDFDLKIVDENGKVYAEDDEVVPKNASIIVRRVPSKNSLVSRLNNRGMYGHGHAAAIAQPKGEILLPMKPEVEDEPLAAPTPPTASATAVAAVAASLPHTAPVLSAGHNGTAVAAPVVPAGDGDAAGDDGDVLKLLAEEETTLKRTVPVTSFAGGPGAGGGLTMSGVPGAGGGRFGGGRGGGAFNRPPPSAGGYTCNRCGKAGHIARYCPTIGDSAFDPEIRLMNVPKTGRKVVATLDGIDTSTSTVIQRSDGSYEVFESSARGLEKLTKEGGSHGTANIDMNAVPPHLKCALSNTLLKEAVTLPCCNKNVNDSVVRVRLVSSGLVCSLCSTPNVSPDSLVIRKDLRDQVDQYVEGLRRSQESPATGSLTSPTLPGFAPPLPAGPPPVPSTLPPMMGGMMMPGMAPGGGMMPGTMGGMGMGMPGMPGMYPGMQMYPPDYDEIPPVEALPLPLSKEQFLYEQRLQIMLLKEMHGGILPHSAHGPGGGGYHGPPPMGGRGYYRGGPGGDFGGRGYRGGGGRGYERDVGGPGGRPVHDAPPAYVPKERDYSRVEEDRQREEVSRRRREDHPRDRADSRERGDGRRRSTEQERGHSRDSRRAHDSRERPGDRGDRRERSADRKVEDSKARGVSRDRKRPAAEEVESRSRSGRGASSSRRDEGDGRESKRRRQEEDRDRDREKEKEREREKEKERERAREKEREKEREREREREREKERERVKERDRERAKEKEREQQRESRKDGGDRGRDKAKEAPRDRVGEKDRDRSRRNDKEGRGRSAERTKEAPRASAVAQEEDARRRAAKEATAAVEAKIKERRGARDYAQEDASGGRRDRDREKEKGNGHRERPKEGEERRRSNSRDRQRVEVIFQDRDKRERGGGIPPLKSSRGADGKGQRIVKL